MTYLEFHLIFTCPLLAVIVWLNRNNPMSYSRQSLRGIGLLLFLAVSYTSPWDSYLIHQEIWQYDPQNILGSFFKIPFEEYFFFVIQTVIGCLFTSLLMFRWGNSSPPGEPVRSANSVKSASSWKPSNLVQSAQSAKSSQVSMASMEPTGPIGSLDFSLRRCLIVLSSMFFLLGLVVLAPSTLELRYFQLILVWASPVIALQWALGWPTLIQHKEVWWSGISILTFYFCCADAIAIGQQIWTFPEATISGLKVFSILPMEEALFFLATNTMVVQGYILFTEVDLTKVNFTRTASGNISPRNQASMGMAYKGATPPATGVTSSPHINTYQVKEYAASGH